MAIVTDGLLAYWNSKQGVSGTTWANIAPATAGNYNATLVGATITADGTRLDGVDDYLMFHIPTEIRSIVPTTFEFRLKLSNYSAEPDVIMVNGNVMFFTRSSGFYSLGLFGISGALNTPLTNSNEYFISMVSNPSAGTFTVYVNGVSAIAATGYQSILKQFANNATATQWITANNGYYPNGIFDNIRFYNRALSAAEIAQNYAVGSEIGLDEGGNIGGTAHVKTLSETISLSENITKRLASFKSFSDSIATSDAISKSLSVIVADTIATSENESGDTNKTVSDSLSIVDNQSSLLAKEMIDSLIISDDDVNKAAVRGLVDNINFDESLFERIERNFSDFIQINDNISLSNSNTRTISLTDSIVILDSISKSLTRSVADNVDLSDKEDGATTKTLIDNIALSDAVTTFGGKTILLTDSISVTDSISTTKQLSRFFAESISITDNFAKQSAQSVRLYDVIVTDDDISVFNPDAPELIGKIYLKGKRELFVYLKGERDLVINLQGKREIFINLKGGLNMITNQNFSLAAGNARTIVIDLSEPNLVGASAVWTMRKRGATTVALTKQGTVIDGKIHIVLNKADTELLIGLFQHECDVIDQSGNESTVTRGTVNIK